MKEIVEKIRREYPTWTAKKQLQPRPPKHIRAANGRRPNCHSVPLRPEWKNITELPTA